MSNPDPNQRPALAVYQPTWEDADRMALRQFVNANPKFLTYLAGRAPKLKTDDLHQAALSGAEHKGFEAIFEVLTGMLHEGEKPEKSPYIGQASEEEGV